MVEELLKQNESGPVVLGDLRCVKIRVTCSPLFRALKAIDALAKEPVEVRAAGRDEVMAFAKTLPASLANSVIREAMTKFALPDTPVTYTDEHVERARQVVREAIATCFICVVDPMEFVTKFVKEVYELRDRHGNISYKIIISSGGGGEFVVTLPLSAFRRGKSIVVPSRLNDILHNKLGIEIIERSGDDLRRLLADAAKPDRSLQELKLRAAFRIILERVPLRDSNSRHGRWCSGGKLYVPTHLIADIIDAFAAEFGNRHAFLHICREFEIVGEHHLYRYRPKKHNERDERDYAHVSDVEKIGGGYAYVFDVEKIAKLLEIDPEEICRGG
jgi:hypothetical protein